MKFMIISDIHGSYDDLSQVIAIFDKSNCDKLVILGDILYHGPRNDLPKGYAPKKCISLLNQYADRIVAVRGNCDAEVDQMVLDFPIRSDYLLMNVDNITMFITHGHLYSEENCPYLKDNDVYIYGHYHKPVLTKKHYYMVNPNSISLPKEGVKSYIIYEKQKFSLYSLNEELLDVLFVNI